MFDKLKKVSNNNEKKLAKLLTQKESFFKLKTEFNQ